MQAGRTACDRERDQTLHRSSPVEYGTESLCSSIPIAALLQSLLCNPGISSCPPLSPEP